MAMRAIRALHRSGLRQGGRAIQRRLFSSGKGGVLVVADHDNSSLGAATLNAVTAAGKLPGDVTVLVGGEGCRAVAEQAASVAGVSRVIVADDPALGRRLAENYTRLLTNVQEQNGFQYIVAPTTTFGKDVLPRFAVGLDVQPIADIVDIKSDDTFVRPVYAGNALATVQSSDDVKLITIRGTAFEAAETGSGSAEIVEASVAGADAGKSKWVKDALSESDRPDLTAADVVISGGRALKSEENFQMIYELADDLKGAAGASRAAVDAGYAPNEIQVGQTGKVVAPNLYVAVGISGAVQHLAGMKDSKTIVAINKDEEAAIFDVADYGLVGDLYDVLPKLRNLIKQ